MSTPNATPDLSKLTINRDDKSFGGARKSKTKIWWGGAVVVVLLAAGYMLRPGAGTQSVDIGVVASAYPSQAITELNATGRVTAQRKASVSTKATGRLEWLGVQEGSRVKAGEVIARLESLDVSASREQTVASVRASKANREQGMAELADAESSFKRAQDLFDKKFISAAQLDTAKARFDKARAAVSSLEAAIGVAEANLKSASVSVEQTLIRAPFDGIVLTKNANVGDIITPFSSATDTRGAVVSMADMDTLEVEADVSENSISKIKLDQPVEIQLDAYPDLRLAGVVSRVVPTVDRSKATLLVKITFKERDPRVLPDMSAKVAFLSRTLTADERKPVTAIRQDAVVKRDTADVAFVAGTDMKVKQVAITLGRKLGDLVEAKGVTPGDKVVIKPGERLKDGVQVAQIKKIAMSPPLVEIHNLVKSYRRGDQVVPVLQDITLSIPRGDFIALMGPSGSGKSTLLNLIAGIDKPDAGTLRVDGTDITALDEAELADWRASHVGFIFQFYNLMPVLNAYENVELPLLLTNLSRRERRERVEMTLAMVGLQDRMDHQPNELSGGQQQRVAIARAIVSDPTLIVADEPTGDLDRKSAEEILGLLRKLNDELHKTIIMVTHDPHAVQSARSVTHLEKGVLIDTPVAAD